jgi:hypothetical protein
MNDVKVEHTHAIRRMQALFRFFKKYGRLGAGKSLPSPGDGAALNQAHKNEYPIEVGALAGAPTRSRG